jgi:hypothetical protein
MAACPRAQHAETILSVVVGNSLDETCQHFPGLRLRTQVIAFQASPKFVGDFHLEAGGWFFPFHNGLTPVTRLQQGIKIHENTLFLTRRPLETVV